MFGFRYLKAPATTYIQQRQGGAVKRSGTGLAFYYYSPWSVIVRVPISSIDVPFAFTEVTSDYQEVTVQGSVTYRVADPELLSSLLDYSVGANGRYETDDPSKLGERIVKATQSAARRFVQTQPLRQVLLASAELVDHVTAALKSTGTLTQLGIEVLEVAVASLSADPEMSKAMQAEARERLLQEADEAIGARRNAAVEMERKIRENELLTERLVAEKEQEVRQAEMNAEIAVEQQRSSLVETRVENQRKEAEAQGAALEARLKPVRDVDWRTLLAISGSDQAPAMISSAFEQLASNAERIGQLNITPDLLSALMGNGRETTRDGGHGEQPDR